MMNVNTLRDAILDFTPRMMNGNEIWPGGAIPPPPPFEGTTTALSSGNTQLVISGLEAGKFAGGYAQARGPVGLYWEVVKIVSNTSSVVTLEVPAQNPAGTLITQLVATSNNQLSYNLGTSIAQLNSIQAELRTTPGEFESYTFDPASSNLDAGLVVLLEPTGTQQSILAGDILIFEYAETLGTGIPEGVFVTLSEPFEDESELTTGEAWSEAYGAMIMEGAAAGLMPLPMSLNNAKSMMSDIVSQLMPVPFMAPQALQAGAIAFWGQIVAGVPTIFGPPAISAIPPPTLTGMAAAILAAGVANNVPGTTKEVAATNLATAMFTTSLGGIVITQPGPSPVPNPFL